MDQPVAVSEMRKERIVIRAIIFANVLHLSQHVHRLKLVTVLMVFANAELQALVLVKTREAIVTLPTMFVNVQQV